MTTINKYKSLEDILGKDQAELRALATGEYETVKLGLLPFTAIDYKEYKSAKNDCMTMIPDGTGGMVPDLDDDMLMVKVVVAGVDKDPRSNFTFANKQLLEKLGVVTAEAAATAILSPGELYKMALEIQTLSGFGPKALKETKDTVKNS